MLDNPVVGLPTVIKSFRIGVLRGEAVINGEDGNIGIDSPLAEISGVRERTHCDESTSMDVDDNFASLEAIFSEIRWASNTTGNSWLIIRFAIVKNTSTASEGLPKSRVRFSRSSSLDIERKRLVRNKTNHDLELRIKELFGYLVAIGLME